MVERDRFERQFGAGWLSAYQYAREGQVSPDGIADKLVASLAKTLREHGGIPAFPEIARIVAQGRDVDVLSAFGALDDFVEQQDGHRHTKIAAEVAKSLIVQWESAGWNVESSEVPGQLAEASCSALIEHYYFAKARQPLLAEGRFANYEESTGWQGQVEDLLRPQLSKISAKLERKPDGSGLRAPNRLIKRECTRDLLAENIVGMQPSDRSMAGRSR